MTSQYRESKSKSRLLNRTRGTLMLTVDGSAHYRMKSNTRAFYKHFLPVPVNMPPKRTTRSSANNKEHTDESSEAAAPLKTGKRKRPAADAKKTNEQTCKASYWLMKSEPESRIENGVDVKFGIEDLKALPNQTGCWDGVRNYQARNFMRDMKVGQQAFFYHSNCKEPGIAGLMKIAKEAYVDHTQFDKKDPHYDPSSKPDNPKWSMVDVQFERMVKRFIPLSELKKLHMQHKTNGGPLKDMALFTRARLSVQPLTAEEFDFVLNLENEDPV